MRDLYKSLEWRISSEYPNHFRLRVAELTPSPSLSPVFFPTGDTFHHRNSSLPSLVAAYPIGSPSPASFTTAIAAATFHHRTCIAFVGVCIFASHHRRQILPFSGDLPFSGEFRFVPKKRFSWSSTFELVKICTFELARIWNTATLIIPAIHFSLLFKQSPPSQYLHLSGNDAGGLGQKCRTMAKQIASHRSRSTTTTRNTRNSIKTIVIAKQSTENHSGLKQKSPLIVLRKALENAPPFRNFVGALRASYVRTRLPGLIAEVKKASPSRGVLREDFDPCPLLCKEFIIDAWQIYYARTKGADAILLIAAVLPDLDIRYMTKICKMLGLAALVEVHNEMEMDCVLG
ncbi:hypothetical protein HHK36_023143 [Tetracentron sinense]|uniref:indole-3-glycerol-phosphate synthase n=1 Tax=Tetracentron sinense TaxID=13715 RepID=A0A835D8E9_TETSI|nr:hypothetical protein HHK36_023143 [Tetracentron sinense]